MTIAEIDRAIKSKEKLLRIEAQEKASYDYLQAQLIIKGIAICLGSKESFPQLHEAYPKLFDDVMEKQEEAIQQQKVDISTLRFKQFAQSYNNNFKNKVVAK